MCAWAGGNATKAIRGRFSCPLSTCNPFKLSQVNRPLNSPPAVTKRLTFAVPTAALYSSGLANVAVPFDIIRIISFDACRRRVRLRLNGQHERLAAIRLCDFGSWMVPIYTAFAAADWRPSYGSLSPALQVLRRHISGKQLALFAVFA
jgi:hypothetical protein